MNIGFVKKTIMALIVSIFLSYILITTKDLLTRIVVIPFLIFGISLFIKNICLIFKKNKIDKCNIILHILFWTSYLLGLYSYTKQRLYTCSIFSTCLGWWNIYGIQKIFEI